MAPNLHKLPTEIILMLADELHNSDVVQVPKGGGIHPAIKDIAALSAVSPRLRQVLLPSMIDWDLGSPIPTSIYWAAHHGNIPMLALILHNSRPNDPNAPWIDYQIDHTLNQDVLAPYDDSFWLPHMAKNRCPIPLDASIRMFGAVPDHGRADAFRKVYPVNPPDFKDWSMLQPSPIRLSPTRMWSPIHLAIVNGHLDAANMLMDYGANPFILSRGLCSCFAPTSTNADLGQFSGSQNVVQWDALHLAICHGGAATVEGDGSPTSRFVRRLLDAPGVSKNSLAGALCSAALKGDIQLVKLLLGPQYGLSVNETSAATKFVTPLSWAFQGGQEKTVVPYLLERGAIIDTKVCSKLWGVPVSLLEFLCWDKRWDSVRLLFSLGVKPDWGAFAFVSIAENLEVARLFVDHGMAFVDGTKKLVDQLDLFCERCTASFRMAKFLLENGNKTDTGIMYHQLERGLHWLQTRTPSLEPKSDADKEENKYMPLYEFVELALEKGQLQYAESDGGANTLLSLIAPLAPAPLKTKLLVHLIQEGLDPSLSQWDKKTRRYHSAVSAALVAREFEACRTMMDHFVSSGRGTKARMRRLYGELFHAACYQSGWLGDQIHFLRRYDKEGDLFLSADCFVHAINHSPAAAAWMIDQGIAQCASFVEGKEKGETALALAMTHIHPRNKREIVEKLLDTPGVEPSDGIKVALVQLDMDIFTLLRQKGGDLREKVGKRDISIHSIVSLFGDGSLDEHDARKDMLRVLVSGLDLESWPEARKAVFERALRGPIFFPFVLERCIEAGQDVNKGLIGEALPLEVLCGRVMKEIRSLHGIWREDPEGRGLDSFKRCVDVLEGHMASTARVKKSVSPSPSVKSVTRSNGRAGTRATRATTKTSKVTKPSTTPVKGRGKKGNARSSAVSATPPPSKGKKAAATVGHGRKLKIDGGSIDEFWNRFDRRIQAFRRRS